MVTFGSDVPASHPDTSAQGFLARTLFNTGHKFIGIRYLWLAFASVLVGMSLSLLMRIHLVWPSAHLPFFSNFAATPERYAALTLLHGSLMVFFVLTTAPQTGFGNYFLPLQIGAREMAFPLLNLICFWFTLASLFILMASFFVSPDSGLTMWTAGVSLFCLAALLTSINFAVTVLDLRAKGMTLPRLPLTVWAWLINAILSMLIFSILLGACAFLFSDLLLGSQFFPQVLFLSRQSTALAPATFSSLWQRLFWFFAQAEVYVAMLPCFGIVSHLLATFSRKPVWAERGVVLALCGVGLFGFCVWGQHMFASGLNPWSPLVFSVLASSLGIPASVLVLSWFATLRNARLLSSVGSQHVAPHLGEIANLRLRAASDAIKPGRRASHSGGLNASMLFALGFVSLFLSGGVSGLFLASSQFAASSSTGDLVTGHFHLVMGVAATFAILAALFFWFPKMFGARLNEPLGKLHFWLTFAGVYCVFLPMHWLGLMTHSGIADNNLVAASADASLRSVITVATIVTVAAQALFLINFVWSLSRRGKSSDRNPWLGTTLEWTVDSPPPLDNFGATQPVVYRGAYEFFAASAHEDFVAQNSEHAPPELAAQRQQTGRANAAQAQQHLNEQKTK